MQISTEILRIDTDIELEIHKDTDIEDLPECTIPNCSQRSISHRYEGSTIVHTVQVHLRPMLRPGSSRSTYTL